MFVITHPLGGTAASSATASNAPVTDIAAEPQANAADGSSIPLPNQKPRLKSQPQAAKPKATVAADAADPPVAAAVKPKPKAKPVVKKPQEDLPWLQHP